MKLYWGSGGIAPCVLDLVTRWKRVVSFTALPLYPNRKSPWHPLDRRLGGSQSQSGHREEKNSQLYLLSLKFELHWIAEKLDSKLRNITFKLSVC
jgi:hypothetical protein